MNIVKGLNNLGLSKNAGEIYVELTKLGSSQAGPLVQKTKLHRVLVYNAIEELIDRGLVAVTRKKNIKIFRALDPALLQQKADQIKKDTQLVVQELRALHAADHQSIDVRTLIGHEGFITNLQDVVFSASKQSDHTMRIIGGAKDTDFYRAVGNWYPDYLDALAADQIKKQLLAPTDYSNVFKKKFANEPRTQLRTLPKGLSSPTYTRITDELVAIEIYEPEIVVIQIRNQAVAKAYRESFELLWRGAK